MVRMTEQELADMAADARKPVLSASTDMLHEAWEHRRKLLTELDATEEDKKELFAEQALLRIQLNDSDERLIAAQRRIGELEADLAKHREHIARLGNCELGFERGVEAAAQECIRVAAFGMMRANRDWHWGADECVKAIRQLKAKTEEKDK